ncbi:MAG: hypothetical protein BVN35_16320 [Proteobacteria bacterium ST_bin11]|nr:MAG: hypothetical protein BVN35_16320 [Proteobacteria bacterium ST_bin11]
MTRPNWTSPAELRAEFEKRWQRGQILAEALADSGLFPLRIGLKQPSTGQISDDFAAARAWVESWQAADGTHFSIEWREIVHRSLGRNRLPATVVFATVVDAARYLKKTRELARFVEMAEALPIEFGCLRDWLRRYPIRLLEHVESWPKLLAVVGWVVEHPRPGIYLRQLSLPGVDTKFIEQHKKLLSEWLDLLLPESAIDGHFNGVGGFERRYGFLAKPQLIRFRLLDSRLAIAGLTDLSVTVDEFAKLDLPVTRVFVTENDVNGLAFPLLEGGMMIFGRGYGFESLARAVWLQDKEIHYWGDIDTHGFAILNQFRRHFPRTRPLLMDEATLIAHRSQWVVEASPINAELVYLTTEEAALYDALRDNRYGRGVRLEQEYVGFALLSERLAALNSVPACGGGAQL